MKEKLISLVVLIGGLLVIVSLSSSIRFFLKKGDLFLEKEKKMEELEKENQGLRADLKNVKSEQFIEKEAREKLNMGKAGEVVVILPPNKQQSNKATKQQEVANWRKWYNLFFY